MLSCEGGRKACYYIPLQLQIPHHLVPLPIALDTTPYGVSYDPIENRIYWTDYYGRINRAFLSNSSSEVVMKGLWRPMDIEIDQDGRNMYFAVEYDNHIKVAKLDGSYETVIVTVESPQGIALDSSSG